MTIRGAAKQASLFERIGALCAGRHFARILKGVYGHGVPAAADRRGFLLHDHTAPAKIFVLPGLVEVRLRDLSPLIGFCIQPNDTAIGRRPGADRFGFELIAKRIDPAFYLGVTGHQRKPAAFFDLIA
ncbi:MAG: hypothetical protein WDN50_09250 [Bradyrhizobium sp.]